ncbi:MAG: DUF2058 domain-containing protein [Methylomonas sp.]|nr:DUF2058 domain-containing protein [Methylomonas sp.]PPD20975.1 MAG: nucleoprotein/polynucleotide-associated enzyme [Methylomonas sp.]PPD27220.1 MAG: nucleoprotein/polynucleotide-associated enzyme [Methylomonas sp.]PPD39170.1 MAG: nucleoprotein/polynucleotide-associated enzyme [Methylomonas sp.]PPD41329.1 MAG: nucleoprotein/polynucleotide-associated enzyme [Methylomonas sp.]
MKKPQLNPLQAQLLKSGLASEAKAREVKAEKRKQDKLKRNNGVDIIDDIKLGAEQARQHQIERDRELNRQRKDADDRKALMAQIQQLAELNRIAQQVDGQSYQFNDDNKVKTVHVSPNVRTALIDGRVGIVRLASGHAIVPAEIARRIQARDAGSVVVLNQPAQQTAAEDDPYAAFQIPDDLLW